MIVAAVYDRPNLRSAPQRVDQPLPWHALVQRLRANEASRRRAVGGGTGQLQSSYAGTPVDKAPVS
jgi:hypothetical protein